ncbi:MAG: hypothetical protein KDC38_05515, partial [Planctomycetes bacterium]|nr:hypothetical protein [Planctomycetota bacterium]
GVGDAFVARLGSDGAIEWCTYFGGAGRDASVAIVPDGDRVWIGGTTNSTDLATTPDATQPATGGGLDAFVTLLDSSQSGASSLVWSSYLGGSASEGLFPSSIGSSTFDVDRLSLDVDASGRVAIVGSTLSANFPTTPDAYQTSLSGGRDCFLTIVDPALSGASSLIWSTSFGGSGEEQAFEVRWLTDGTCAVAGTTVSSNFPVTPSAFQTSYGGGSFDGFVLRFDPSLDGAASLLASTFFGGSGDDSIVSMDGVSGTEVVVAGNSTAMTATTPDAWFPSYPASSGFAGRVQIFDLALSGPDMLRFSSFLSGPGGSVMWGADVNGATLTLAGWTAGDDFPLVNPFDGPAVDFLGAVAAQATLSVSTDPQFRRGDTNDDAFIDIGDAIYGLSILFSGATSHCADAEDVNDDGNPDIADMIYLLGVLFVPGSPAIPAPMDCGVDPTPDGLDCATSACVP